MTEFRLDPRLERDTFELGRLNGQILLLMNNALVPWLILVPRSHHLEVHHLSEGEQLKLWNISYSEGAAPCLSYTLQQGEVACPKATCYQTGKCWCDSADPNYSGECEVCSRHQGGEGCGD